MQNTIAIDIETTGLNKEKDSITVICLYGVLPNNAKVEKTLNFLKDDVKFDDLKQQLLDILNAAGRITTFNGIRFDFPFIECFLNINSAVVSKWLLKTFDLWEICKVVMRGTFKLDEALKLNGFECKIADGKQALEWAKNPNDWQKLEEYCMADTVLTYQLSQLPCIMTPLVHGPLRYCVLQNANGFIISMNNA